MIKTHSDIPFSVVSYVSASLHACTQVHSVITAYPRVSAHRLDGGSLRKCELEPVRVIAIIMPLSQPDSLLLSTQACARPCLFVTSWARTDKELVEDGTMLADS